MRAFETALFAAKGTFELFAWVVRFVDAGDADYQSMQQFLSDSPWDPVLVVKAVAERVAGEIDVEAGVLDDTGFPKQGKRSFTW